VSGCHLSLDRSKTHTDGPVPYVTLHIHGSFAGAQVAVQMCTAILQRHVNSMEAQFAVASTPASPVTKAADISEQPRIQFPVPCELPMSDPTGSPGTPAVAEQPKPTSDRLSMRRRWLRQQKGSDGESD
jgi:hypothetical protein